MIPTVAVRLRRDFALAPLADLRARDPPSGQPRPRQERPDRRHPRRLRSRPGTDRGDRSPKGSAQPSPTTYARRSPPWRRRIDAAQRPSGIARPGAGRTRPRRPRDTPPTRQAVDAGVVVNTNPGRGKTALYKLGDPIPDDLDVLPDIARLHHAINPDKPDSPAADTERDGPPSSPNTQPDDIWLARDGNWRSLTINPPVFVGEIIETRQQR